MISCSLPQPLHLELSPVPSPAPGHITHTPGFPCVGAHPCKIPKGFGSSPTVWAQTQPELPPCHSGTSPSQLSQLGFSPHQTQTSPAPRQVQEPPRRSELESDSVIGVICYSETRSNSWEQCRGVWHSPRRRLPLVVCLAPRLDKQVHEQFCSHLPRGWYQQESQYAAEILFRLY